MPFTVTSTEYLEVNSVPLQTPAWACVDLTQLWDSAEVKGGDLDIPHAHGSMPLPRRRKTTVFSVPMFIYGDRDSNNGTYSNQRFGCYTNFAYLRANVFAPISTGTGTVSATLHMADGSTTLTATITPLGSTGLVGVAPWTRAKCVFMFSIATGQFA